MKRKMSERQMWLHIAKCINAASREGVCGFRVEGYFARGLCGAIEQLSLKRKISNAVHDSAKSKITPQLLGNEYWPYAWADGDLRSRERFCRKQAKLLEKKKKPTSR